MRATILVIDDDPSIVHLLKEDLEVQGYRVLEGYDGHTALEIASSARPQLIIMDMNMPGISGLAALGVLRQNPLTATIPVLFLTGDDAGALPAGVLGQQRVGHLTK